MSIFCGIAIVFVTLLPPIECLLNQGAISGGHEDKLVTELIQNVTRLNQAMDAASAREQANMADLIKANIQLQQNFTRLQQTIADDKQRIEYIEKERADHNRTNTCEQQRLIELESAEINNNKTITELRQRIYELEKETVEQNRTITIQQQRIDELENAAVNYTKTSINQGQKIDELEIKILDHNKTNTVQQQRIDELKDANINYNKTLLGQQQKMNEIENVNFGLHQTLSCINRTFVMYQTKIDSRMNQSFGAYQVILHDIVDKHNQHVSVFNNQSIALNQSVADLGKQFHYLSLSLLDTEKKYAAINASLTGTYELISKWPLPNKAVCNHRQNDSMNNWLKMRLRLSFSRYHRR